MWMLTKKVVCENLSFTMVLFFLVIALLYIFLQQEFAINARSFCCKRHVTKKA